MTAAPAPPAPGAAPSADCPACPRLVAYRAANRAANPDWHNAPVPSWGPRAAPLLVLGLAPGVRGANRTGRPFTGDYAGRLLYGTLLKFGLARGEFREDPNDGMELTGCRIANAVRCVPPENLPTPAEIRTCNGFLQAELAAMPGLRAVLALGVVAHAALLRAKGIPASRVAFAHGAVHALPGGLLLADSYHVSRYNTSTRRLTPEMFEAVVEALLPRLG
ncbi:uracil-DNA glycosylase [Roseomonas sp. HF4]|uniref:uracil-DNA glycosylase n=1 Tax=Roseomonas sp. HF4 TaxID=2562313 RepID=UPI0010C1349F|nr:uracil-DNA glycosylase [Roseomonas sp. HF4]